MITDVLRSQQLHQFLELPHYQCATENHDASAHFAPRVAQAGAESISDYGGFQQRMLQPRQYVAHPMQRPSFSQSPAASLQTSKLDGAEHMLRRKTPNGTLAAGYDGNPTDLDARPHATKHFLMPASYTMRPMKHQISGSDSYTDHVLPSRIDRSHRAGFVAGQRHLRHADYQQRPVDSSFVNGSRGYHAQGVDSVLSQGVYLQHDPNLMNDHHVPTVLQPMWPPCIGLTSLNDPGLCGPYWPDGAYEPYRPAPVRDPRYHQQMERNGKQITANASLDVTNLPENRINPHLQRQENSNRSDSKSLYFEQQPLRKFEPTSRHRFSVPEAESVASRQHNRRPTLYRDLAHSPNEPQERDKWGLSDLQYTLNGMAPYPARQGSNAQFKEKVLAWAHRIYVSLLATIHQSRRSEPNGQHSAERHFPTNVYPKPPRQPLFHPATATVRESITGHNPQGSTLESGFKDRLALDQIQEPQTIHRPGDAHIATYALRQSPSTWVRTCGQSLPTYKQQNASVHSGQHQLSQLYSYSGPTGHIQSQHQRSPATTAINALEMLSRLCAESSWQWTDGMLLGGCLAYGLGDFPRALRWYGKVLDCDPNNVEAISNLAATLLALGRRDEAEQHWRRSIQLRPGYFEAVEHLVGLFCEDRRGKEAVKIIEFVQHALQTGRRKDAFQSCGYSTESASEGSLSPENGRSAKSDLETSDLEMHANQKLRLLSPVRILGGSSGYAIPPCDNGRMLALVHGKGNMLYALGDNAGAAKAFEDAILIGSGRRCLGIHGLIKKILKVFAVRNGVHKLIGQSNCAVDEPVLLMPEVALETSCLVFPPRGQLPGLSEIANGVPQKAAVSIISNSLLSLAKIYQDGMSSSGATATGPRATSGVQDILALYYLSLSLQPSPSTANNVGILLASVQQSSQLQASIRPEKLDTPMVPGVVPGSGIALALAYYNYGLILDSRHAHLYTNLGSLFKDIGQLDAAIKMYEKAVECDSKFDIALANLANAVKDRGRIGDAIMYYQKAVSSNPDFAEAVCGLANALNSVCSWRGRGGIKFPGASRDRWHVDDDGMLYDARHSLSDKWGWIGHVVAIVDKQLAEGESWGKGILQNIDIERLLRQSNYSNSRDGRDEQELTAIRQTLQSWANRPWEGAKVVRLIERATKRLGWKFYRRKYIRGEQCAVYHYSRPHIPPGLAIPSAPTVLPFHTFTCPLTARQIRQISQRNGLRISCSTLRASWLPAHIYEPPHPPNPQLRVGYVSSDFNNHPLAHLMQSVFGLHDKGRVRAYCYATTASDGSVHRQQIEREAPIFLDASSWSIDRLVKQIVGDGIHILINLNGYTRGARNEVFAARPAPIQMSFMGFAGTLGAEWCDYLLADKIAIPPSTLRPNRLNVDLLDQSRDGNNEEEDDNWVYGENIIFTRDTFFCCDHRQSAPDAQEAQLSWHDEQERRWKMRKELFPTLPDDVVILGNFNQLYKIEPTTFRTWLRILSRLPKAVLWLLRFPDLGESYLRELAVKWVSKDVAGRIIFTDVAPKSQHIARARVCDLFLDTPECNAHTTAADVLWSGTPLLTFPRYEYKMCSRMAASILTGALPNGAQGERAARELIAKSDAQYEEQAVALGSGLVYPVQPGMQGFGQGRLVELRKLLYESRRTSALFDTRRWVGDLENAYEEAWSRWVAGAGGDIWL